jgi:hypothetical protein
MVRLCITGGEDEILTHDFLLARDSVFLRTPYFTGIVVF